MSGTDIANFIGANHLANGQSTAGAASGQIVPAKATRRSVTVRNIHATESCYIGYGTVTSNNGFPLKAGESISIDSIKAVSGIRAGSVDVPIAWIETYESSPTA